MIFNINSKQFDRFLRSFSESERGDILYLLYGARKKISLSPSVVDEFLKDYMRAIMHLYRKGMPMKNICQSLNYSKLGDFYLNEKDRWYPLDSAAKIYPLSMSSRWMAMYRLSCYLKEDIVPEILQMALTFTIKRFPYFAVCLKKGVFWHYLDGVCKHFSIMEENMRPFTSVKLSGSEDLPFRVIYYKNRISVEFFHILTDGMGGNIFIKTLVGEYLRILGSSFQYQDGFWDIEETPCEKEWADDFKLAPKDAPSGGLGNPTALALKGKITKHKPYQIYHFEMDSSKLKQVANEKGMTITAYVISLMFRACNFATVYKRNRLLQIEVPKNLRDYYPSQTLRNYSLFGLVKFSKDEVRDTDLLQSELPTRLRESVSKDVVTKAMVSVNKTVSGIRLIPRVIKGVVARPIYGLIGDSAMTSICSNLGVAKIPEGIEDKIEKLEFCLGPQITNGAVTAMITCNGITSFSITKMIKESTFEDYLLELFTKDGIDVKIYGSEDYDVKRIRTEKKYFKKEQKRKKRQARKEKRQEISISKQLDKLEKENLKATKKAEKKSNKNGGQE